jgi:uncharacterized protein YyaL (SSP411 family)
VNHLAGEASAYLLQHANQPVDWYPYGEAALARAREAHQPIFLSIGYAACHWCHVMAEECFEDPEIAALLNASFLNIKIDRELRPDLDHIYQTAHRWLTGRPGGWPLSVFVEPDQLTPFFAGTYFPREPRYGLPGFGEIILTLSRYYREQTGDWKRLTEKIRAAFTSLAANPSPSAGSRPAGADLAAIAETELEGESDRRFGGFGDAPKFPHPASLAFLLERIAVSSPDPEVPRRIRPLLDQALTAMTRGGLQDQVGGGFFRYCVDAGWEIPHFEKMLDDNALLLALYADASVLTGQSAYARTAASLVDWLAREMRAPEGGFYSSLDADSPGGEGHYYLWDRSEVQALLTPAEWAVAKPAWGLDRSPNFENRWHLSRRPSPERDDRSAGTGDLLLENARLQLLRARSRRVAPARDDKIRASSNGLAVWALARAGRVLDRPDWVEMALQCNDFLATALVQDNRLMTSWRQGKTGGPAFLPDHAYVLQGLVELLGTRWETREYEWALILADQLLERFEDRSGGGFWFTAHDQPTPLVRLKTWSDESAPAANAVAFQALLTLSRLSGRSRYQEAALRGLAAGLPHACAAPGSHLGLILSLCQADSPPPFLLLQCAPEDRSVWLALIHKRYSKNLPVFAPGPDGPIGNEWAFPAYKPGEARLYLCEGTACKAVFSRPDELGGEPVNTDGGAS